MSTAGVLFFLSYPGNIVLKLTATKSGRVVFCAPVTDGEEFLLSFIHSVNKRPVYETLRVAGNHLLIVKSRYDSFGAGMPETSTQEGSLKVDSNSWLEWTVNREVPEVSLFIGWVSHQTLRLKGREVALTELAKPGTSLSIQTRRVSYYRMWKSGCLP
ncbi:MAG: hypothetical protein H6Q42_3145 [Deltaproteobacteria bacterium]|nr:hypothetical protein [Deltaproteobacteria bacterium]